MPNPATVAAIVCRSEQLSSRVSPKLKPSSHPNPGLQATRVLFRLAAFRKTKRVNTQ